MDGQQERVACNAGKEAEILEHVNRHALAHRWHDRQSVGGREHQRVAVTRALGGRLHADQRTRARAVVDDPGAAGSPHGICQQPGDRVVGGSGRKWNDDLSGLLRQADAGRQ